MAIRLTIWIQEFLKRAQKYMNQNLGGIPGFDNLGGVREATTRVRGRRRINSQIDGVWLQFGRQARGGVNVVGRRQRHCRLGLHLDFLVEWRIDIVCHRGNDNFVVVVVVIVVVVTR